MGVSSRAFRKACWFAGTGAALISSNSCSIKSMPRKSPVWLSRRKEYFSGLKATDTPRWYPASYRAAISWAKWVGGELYGGKEAMRLFPHFVGPADGWTGIIVGPEEHGVLHIGVDLPPFD